MSSARGQNVPEAALERAVPPGLPGYDLDASVLLPHTRQAPRAAFRKLVASGVLDVPADSVSDLLRRNS